MEILDVSIPIRTRMPIYPANAGVALRRIDAIADGAVANVTAVDLGAHTGTHVDAPNHFLDGAGGVETVALEPLIGPAVVVDATAVDKTLDAAAVAAAGVPTGAERVLFRTRNSQLWEQEEFNEDFVSFDASGARALLDAGVRLVGIDYLSIGDEAAHEVLLGNGVVPLEGLDLREVDPGRYRLYCLPLKVVGSDGAPARVLLEPL
jgi:arylformamidase